MFDVSLTGFDAAEIEDLFLKVHDKDVKEDDFDAGTEAFNFREAFKEEGFYLSSVCIWVEQSLVLGRSDY